MSSDTNLQDFARKVWNHTKREADMWMSHEIIIEQVRAFAEKNEIEEAREKLKGYRRSLRKIEKSDLSPEEKDEKRERELQSVNENSKVLNAASKLSSMGIEPVEENVRRYLADLHDRYRIRFKTAKSGVICVDLGLHMPLFEGKDWLDRSNEIIKKGEDFETGKIFDTQKKIIDVLGSEEMLEKGKEVVSSKMYEIYSKILLIDTYNSIFRRGGVREKIEKEYKNSVLKKEYYPNAEGALRRINQKLEQISEALRLLRRYDELFPVWKTEAQEIREKMKETPIGTRVEASLPESIEEKKEILFEEKYELKARSGAKMVVLEVLEKGEDPPSWEQFLEDLEEEVKCADISSRPEGVNAERCQAVAQLNPDEIESVPEMADRVSEMINDPQTSPETLRYSLNQLELEGGQKVFFSPRERMTEEEREEALKKRIARARAWCEENHVPY